MQSFYVVIVLKNVSGDSITHLYYHIIIVCVA